ncbi:aldehyde dehydrogenase family protein, partial [Pseudomonas amygdali]
MSTPSYANEAVSLNPSNGQELARYPYQSPAELEAALRGVQNGFEQWRDVSVADRAEILKKMAVALRTNKDALARMEAVEMGKPISQGRAEVEKTANL